MTGLFYVNGGSNYFTFKDYELSSVINMTRVWGIIGLVLALLCFKIRIARPSIIDFKLDRISVLTDF